MHSPLQVLGNEKGDGGDMSCPVQANETCALSFFLEWKFLFPLVCSPLNTVIIAKVCPGWLSL